MRKPRVEFSKGWMFTSIFDFTCIEILMGGYVGPLLAGRFVSQILELKFEVVLVLLSYLVGGFLIGFFSPTVRVIEPVVGAFVAALLPFLIGVLSPSRFYIATGSRMLLAGALSAFLAYIGADAGERACAHLGNRDSQAYAKNAD